jgi:hypothetical protein
VEFQQPAIIAEGLAEAAVHEPWIGPLLLPAEKLAAKRSKPSKSLIELVKEVEADANVKHATNYNESPAFRVGVMKHGLESMIQYGSQYSVDESELTTRLAETIEAAGTYKGQGYKC